MIAPQTNVRLLNTPLENDGANTLTWTSVDEQKFYFLNKTVFSFNEFTYQRKEQVLRINKNIDQLYKCNYVMYQNSGYSNKWFYAFIDRLEYINDDVTFVYIVPDEFQTWYFDISFKDSFVYREHTNDDSIGANRTDEGLGVGSYTVVKKEKMYDDEPLIAILTPYNSESGDVINYGSEKPDYITINARAFGNAVNHTSQSDILTFDGVFLRLRGIDISGNEQHWGITSSIPHSQWTEFSFSFTYTFLQKPSITYRNGNYIGYGVKDTKLDLHGFSEVQQWFDELSSQGLADDIGAFYITTSAGGNTTTPSQYTPTENKTFKPVYSINGYTPKNNKLFCFPYTILKLHNANDSSRILQPELFYNYDSMEFKYWCDHLPTSPVTAIPLNYGGASESYEYAINSAKYPISSASYDAFKNYLGLHATEYNIQVASRLASGRLSVASGLFGLGRSHIESVKTKKGFTDKTTLASGKIKTYKHAPQKETYTRDVEPSVSGRIGSVINGATEIALTLAENNAKQREAYDTVGGVQSNALQSVNAINIYIEQQSITYDYAKRIDDYFSMFGYKTNLVKIPNLTGRRNWNYVETKQCNIVGQIPNESIDTIREMFNNGVTLWHNPETYLDYSQDNSII